LEEPLKILYLWVVFKIPFPKNLCGRCIRSIGKYNHEIGILFLKSSLVTKKDLCFSAGLHSNIELLKAINKRYQLNCLMVFLGAVEGGHKLTLLSKIKLNNKKDRSLWDYKTYFEYFLCLKVHDDVRYIIKSIVPKYHSPRTIKINRDFEGPYYIQKQTPIYTKPIYLYNNYIIDLTI